MDQKILNQQSQHWEKNFSNKPEMFGLEPSLPAKKALKLFQEKKIDKIGVTIQFEQRYYDLLSDHYSFDNWKYYLDGRAKMWVDWDIIDNIGVKTYYQFRWRDASTQIYGDFDWVEDIKSYRKHEIWLEFSYKFITDILY